MTELIREDRTAAAAGAATSAAPASAAPEDATDRAPFDLPVLDELPELASVLERLVQADALIASAIDVLVRLRATGEVESATGVSLDGWLATIARRTGSDRRMLLTIATSLAKLPRLHRAYQQRALSFSQLRAVVLQVASLPIGLDDRVDTLLTCAVGDAADMDPDSLSSMVRWMVADLLADGGTEPPATTGPQPIEKLILQPRLDGSGGSVFGELGPVGFAALDAATDPDRAPRIPDSHAPVEPGAAGRAAARARRLTELCLGATPGGDDPDGPRAHDGPAGAQGTRGVTGVASDVELLLRVELETLLGWRGRPSQLLTRLTGGAMWLDAPAARRLADTATGVRLVVTGPDGAPLGVGRRRRLTPGWLRAAVLAVHDTCTHPGCARPALTADMDHARTWAEGGTTDIANLAPLCAHHNRRPERRRWRITQTADGERRWHHRPTGLTTATRPDRPPARPIAIVCPRCDPPGPGGPAPPAGRSGPPKRRDPRPQTERRPAGEPRRDRRPRTRAERPPRPARPSRPPPAPHPAGPGASRTRPPPG